MRRGPGDFYETNVVSEDNPPPLENKKFNSLGRQCNIIRKM